MEKVINIFIFFLLILTACKSEKKQETATTFVSFGNKISAENPISDEEMGRKFETLQIGDTIDVKFTGEISAVCQKKGCWIKVPLNDKKQSFVRFKDYGFFLPMNAAGSKVILNGKAFKNKISVKQLQHYAKDASKSAEEIAKITEPKITYSFLADGVLLEAKADAK